MNSIFIQLILLIAGFLLLIKGADWFVDGAAGIAAKMGVPELVVGLTIVAMGTSAPEAAISISSALKGSADIAVGNVLGSNIMNILLILGLTSLITPLLVQKSTIRYEVPFLIVISAVFPCLGLFDNVLGRLDGVILWIFFIAYLLYLLRMAKQGADVTEDVDIDENAPVWKLLLLLLVGVGLIILGSNLTVDAATFIALHFGMSQRLVGLTIVAFGTSLPELVTCITAARKNSADIAIGNIVGSNIFNMLFVIGTSALITPVAYQAAFLLDSIVAIAVAALLLILVLNKKQTLKRSGGLIMLVLYIIYCFYIF